MRWVGHSCEARTGFLQKISRRTATSFSATFPFASRFHKRDLRPPRTGAAESGLKMNMSHTKTRILLLSLGGAATLFAAGCASHPYYPPPPPPYAQRPPLIDLADHNGFRAGTDDGARDAYNGRGYRPQHNRNFRDTPGYNPALGPFEPYRRAFRDAYLRGYDNGFRRQQPPPQ